MELKKYTALIRHWLWLILLGAVVAGGAAYVFSSRQTPLYRAEATYEIDVAGGTASNSEYVGQLVAQNLIPNYLRKIPTTDIATKTLEALADDDSNISDLTASSLLGKISLSSPIESSLINISVIDTDPGRAAAIANTIGEVFAIESRIQQEADFSQPIALLDTRLDDLQAEMSRLRKEIRELNEITTTEEQAEYDRLQRELTDAATSSDSVFESRLALEVSMASSFVSFDMVEPAKPNSIKISPKTNTNTILAAIVGAMLTLGVILLFDYLDDSIKTPDDATKVTGASTLATIAYIKGEKPSDRLITQTAPRAPISEAYRVLRTNLSFSAIDTGLNSVLVTSSAPAEGKSTTSANIAVVIAQTGRRVILVDADLRKPSQHKVFNASNNQGLTTALLDNNTPVSAHLQPTKTPGLMLLASGPLPPNPSELLNSQRMREVLDELLTSADFVLVDTPPVLTVADAAILAPKVNGCVLVAEIGQTGQDTLKESAERLRSTGARLFGLVLNRSKAGTGGYYQYYYSDRYYTYEYGPNPPEQKSRKGLLGRLSGSSGS